MNNALRWNVLRGALIAIVLVLMLVLALAGGAVAQAYPNKPIRLVVGYPAGGGADALARLLATRLSDALGQQVLVDNRPGASSAIASDYVAKAAPDGYTLYFADSAMLVAPSLSSQAGYDPIRSFTPISGAVTLPLVLVANPAIGANTLDGVIKLIKSRPGQFNYGSPGVGTIQHLAMELFKQRAGLFVLHIPYRGAAPIIPDLISGQISFAVISAGPALAQVKGGKINAIAITSETRLDSAPEWPTLAQKFPGFNAAPNLFFVGPAGLPEPMVARLNQLIREILARPDTLAALAAQGATAQWKLPAHLGVQMENEFKVLRSLVRERKITAE
jgi:tripartite-type tricarboxylate transporter receptor subunit TctC